MRSKLAGAILQARRAAGLTQEQLGRRVGLTGRAVYRWERDDSAPTNRNQAALVTAFTAVRPELGTWFAQAIAPTAESPSLAPESSTPAAESTKPAAESPTPSATTQGDPQALERAVFALADELDLPPRRARGALKRLVARLCEARLSLDAVQGLLEEWTSRAE